MVLIIDPRGLILPLKTTRCLTHTSTLLAASSGARREDVSALQGSVDVLGGACSAAVGLRLEGCCEPDFQQPKQRSLISDQQLLFF